MLIFPCTKTPDFFFLSPTAPLPQLPDVCKENKAENRLQNPASTNKEDLVHPVLDQPGSKAYVVQGTNVHFLYSLNDTANGSYAEVILLGLILCPLLLSDGCIEGSG